MCDRSVLDVEQPMHRRGSVVTPTITGIVCHSSPSDEVKKTTCATRLKNKPYALIESAVRSDRTSLRLTRGLGEGTHRSRRRKWRARWGRRGGRDLRGGEVGRDLGSALVARPAGAVQPQHEAARRGRRLHPDDGGVRFVGESAANANRLGFGSGRWPDGSFCRLLFGCASTSDPMIGSPTLWAVWRGNCLLL
jgi:hypothetical protein